MKEEKSNSFAYISIVAIVAIVAVVVMFSGSGSSKQTPEPIQLSNDLVGEATERSLNHAILATQLIKEEPLFREISEKEINQIVDLVGEATTQNSMFSFCFDNFYMSCWSNVWFDNMHDCFMFAWDLCSVQEQMMYMR